MKTKKGLDLYGFPLIKLAKKLKDASSCCRRMWMKFPLIKLAKKLKEVWTTVWTGVQRFEFPLIKLAKKLKAEFEWGS